MQAKPMEERKKWERLGILFYGKKGISAILSHDNAQGWKTDGSSMFIYKNIDYEMKMAHEEMHMCVEKQLSICEEKHM